MKIDIHPFCFNELNENTYILSDQDRNCVIIDAGCYERDEQAVLIDFIRQNQFTPKALLSTHAHIDHVLGNSAVLQAFPMDYYLHMLDVPTLQAVSSYAHIYGFDAYAPSPMPTHLLHGGETLQFGGIHLDVLFTPGHSVGHVVFYNQENHFVINGDVLFNGSFGRYDLPGGDLETLKHSIHSVLFQLPEETIVFTGHGQPTTIEKEKYTNPILTY